MHSIENIIHLFKHSSSAQALGLTEADIYYLYYVKHGMPPGCDSAGMPISGKLDYERQLHLINVFGVTTFLHVLPLFELLVQQLKEQSVKKVIGIHPEPN